ncbi:MAG: TolC family protein [Bryobacteraceae bacterium]|nr:TolC family protein [Bryobacteraceae bacterium]
MKKLFPIAPVLMAAAFAADQGQQGTVPPMPAAKEAEKIGPQFPRFGTKEYFKYVFNPDAPRVELAAPVKLADHVVDGKIELSLRSYLELVVANNTDIQIQKVLVEPQRNAITRAFAVFDPVIAARFNASRQITPTTDALAGAATLSQLNQPANLNYTQTLASGTQLNFGYRFNKLSNNNSFQNFNPAYNSNVDLNFTQPLLRGRGMYITKLPVLIARARLQSAEFGFEDQLQRLVLLAENAYWDVIGARENLRVQEQALSLADASLKRAQRELELGAISALEIYQPQAQYARAEITVTQARYRLQQTEDALRRQVGLDLDPDLRKLPLQLSEPVLPPTDTKPIDREALVSEALRMRPDLKTIQTNLNVDDYNIKLQANTLKPDLSLLGNYTTQGRGGPQVRNVTATGSDGLPLTNRVLVPGGFGDAWSQMWGFGFPVYGFGIQLRLPLKDRAAAANYADATVQKKLDALRLRQGEQNTRLEVLNAISQVENSRASVDLAKISADLAQKSVEAEQKKYDLGVSTLFFLLDQQNRLTQAQSDLVNNSVQYRRNLLNLLQRTGTLLQDRGIVTK